MSEPSKTVYQSPIGGSAFQTLDNLIGFQKNSDPLHPVTVITSSLYTGIYLRRELSRKSGLANVKFMTLPRLATELGAPALLRTNRLPLTPILESATIRKLARDSGTDGPLSQVSDHPGLPALLTRAFSELSRLDSNSLTELGSLDSLRSQIVEWYQLFKSDTQAYYSTTDLLITAEQTVKNHSDPTILNSLGYVVFYLLTDLRMAEARLIQSIISEGKASVILGLVGEESLDIDTESIGRMVCPGYTPSTHNQRTITLPDPAKLISTPDAREEIKWISRDIARRCEAGTPFHRMAVLYRQQNPYATFIPTQLRMAGIPVAGPDPIPVNSTPAGRFLTGMLSSINSNLSRTTIMNWLSESQVKINTNGANNEVPYSDWELLSKRAGIVKGFQQWKDQLHHLRERLTNEATTADEREELSMAKRAGIRRMAASVVSLQHFISELTELSTTPAQSNWSDLVSWLKTLLQRYSMSEEHWPADQRAILQRLMNTVDELETLDQTELTPNKENLLEILNQVLESPSGPLGEFGKGVFIAAVPTVKGMSFDIIYLVGLNEGDFPTAAPHDSLLPFEVMESVSDDQERISRQAYRLKERRDYLTAIESSAEYVLSYPRSDSGSQKPKFPSPWFMDALRQFHSEPISSYDIPLLGNHDWIEVIQSPLHSLGSIGKTAPADLHDRDVASVSNWTSAGKQLKEHYLASPGSYLSRFMAHYESRTSQLFTRWDGDISSADISDPAIGDRPMSPTGLESWAKCPFSYFLSHIMGLKAIDIPEDVLSISALEKGSLVHRILERLVNEQVISSGPDQDSEIDADKQTSLIYLIAEEEFKKAEDRGISGKPLLWENTKSEILRDLLVFQDENSTWLKDQGLHTLWTEKPFGFDRENSLDPLEITLKNGGKISFRGMIDRVDINDDNTRIVVTDYKTGSTTPYQNMDKDSIDAGKRLQLPIYAITVGKATGISGDIEASYWFVTSASNFDRKLINLQEIKDRFDEVIEGIGSGISQGVFPANPGPPTLYGPENCRFCDFDRICPSNRVALWNRKSNDQRIDAYNSLSHPVNKSETPE